MCPMLEEYNADDYNVRGGRSDYLWQLDPRIENAQIGSAKVRFKGSHLVRNTLKYILTVSEYRVYSVAKSYRGAKLFACC